MKALLLLVAGIGGLIETLVPRAVVRAWTKALYRNAGEAEPREWVYAATRAEGAVVVLAALVGLYGVATAEEDEPDASNRIVSKRIVSKRIASTPTTERSKQSTTERQTSGFRRGRCPELGQSSVAPESIGSSCFSEPFSATLSPFRYARSASERSPVRNTWQSRHRAS